MWVRKKRVYIFGGVKLERVIKPNLATREGKKKTLRLNGGLLLGCGTGEALPMVWWKFGISAAYFGTGLFGWEYEGGLIRCV